MQTMTHRPSATILAFPAGGRRSAANLSFKTKFAAEVRAIRELKVLAESSWYHQEAIESADPAKKI